MTPERWQHVREVLEAALRVPAGERPAWLEAACGGDDALRDEVARLLAHEDAGFLDASAHVPASLTTTHPTTSSALPPGEPPLPVQEIGPYRVLAIVGRGGMGEVFKARDTRLDRHVAIKLLGPRLSANPGHAQLLMREARAAARLNHPNIAAVHDVIDVHGRTAIVMEFLEGETLAARLGRGPLAIGEVCDVGAAVARGLAHAHRHGVLHCDLKPANVFLTRGGDVKILDFGLARSADRASGTTSAGIGAPPALVRHRAGTPAYMAPEQWLGHALDRRTDIYCLGVSLHEMATGRRPPVTRPSDTTTPAAAHPRLDPAVPRPLRAVIARAIATDPVDRHQEAEEFERALRAVVDRRAARPGVLLASGLPVGLAVAASVAVLRPATTVPRSGEAAPAVVKVAFAGQAGPGDGLSSGLADLLASELSRETDLVVILDAAAESGAGGRGLPTQATGQGYLVRGLVQPAGEDVAVTALLVEEPAGRVVWSLSLETPRDSAVAVVRPIRDGVVRAFRARGLPADPHAGAGRPPLPTRDAEAFRVYGEAIAFLERPDVPGNAGRAIALLRAAIARDGGFAAAHAALGRAHWLDYELTGEARALEAARRAATDALRLDDSAPGVRATLAMVESASGRDEVAVEELRREIASYPNSSLAHRLLGRILADGGRLEDAEREFRQAIALRPLFWENYRALGLAYFDAGRLDEAATAFERITQLQPDNAWGHQQLATVRHAQGRLDPALEGYERANRLSPTPAAWSNIGSIRYGRREFAAAVNAYAEAIRLNPKSAVTHRNLGDAYRRLGDPRRAREAYVRAIALADETLAVNPKHVRMLALSALCLAKTGRGAEAAARSRAAVELAPTSIDAWHKRAAVLVLTRDLGAATAALGEALRLGASRDALREDEDLAPLLRLEQGRSLLEAGRKATTAPPP